MTRCYAITREHIQKTYVTKMCMLRLMCSKTLKDKIRNIRTRKYLRITPKMEKIKKRRLTWYDHVTRKLPVAPTKRCLHM